MRVVKQKSNSIDRIILNEKNEIEENSFCNYTIAFENIKEFENCSDIIKRALKIGIEIFEINSMWGKLKTINDEIYICKPEILFSFEVYDINKISALKNIITNILISNKNFIKHNPDQRLFE